MKLNRKGYMLIEIILASAIAFGVGYFILQMIINLKNKNDDLLAKTLTTTDQTIITNKLMQYAMEEKEHFTCKITTDGKTLYYEDKDGNKNIIDIVNDYAVILADENGALNDCSVEDGMVYFSVPMRVAQMPNENFDATLNYRYDNLSNSSNSNGPDDDDEVCVVKYNCGEEGYWNLLESNTFTVAQGDKFKLTAYYCIHRVNSFNIKQFAWDRGGTKYYFGTEFTCSEKNKEMIFNVAWKVCSCKGSPGSYCNLYTTDGDVIVGIYDSSGSYCINNGTICCQ